ncbi:hypothetical protein F5877DRAFT_73566, partial [Lentinula edodes]
MDWRRCCILFFVLPNSWWKLLVLNYSLHVQYHFENPVRVALGHPPATWLLELANFYAVFPSFHLKSVDQVHHVYQLIIKLLSIFFRSRKSNRTRKPTNRLLGSEMLLSLPRTARPSSGVIGSPDASHSDGHFSEVEAAASDADCSDGVYETNAHDHSSNSVIVGEQVGDQSPIEWSPTPPRGQALEAQDESANEMDAEPSPKKSVTVVPHELYSNRVRRGTPEESRPSSPKVY